MNAPKRAVANDELDAGILRQDDVVVKVQIIKGSGVPEEVTLPDKAFELFNVNSDTSEAYHLYYTIVG